MPAAAKNNLLLSMLKQIAPDGDLDAVDIENSPSLESVAGGGSGSIDIEENVKRATRGLKSLKEGKPVSEEDQFGLEAIIMPKYRPAIPIVDNSFSRPADPWQRLNRAKPKQNIKAAILSVGRIELPNRPSVPFAGTGFVVGTNLIMTNRHVAELFVNGLGNRDLKFKVGETSFVDFKKETGSKDSDAVEVKDVLMVHPYWDMAILKVNGLSADRKPLALSTIAPTERVKEDVVVIGYPAFDPRNDLDLQTTIFGKEFDVKRLQPGKIRGQDNVSSFGNSVMATTHDASTLGGNSGSAVLHVGSGEVVALHFGGIYLKANYAVPIVELARDRRIRELGLNFCNDLPAISNQWENLWLEAENRSPTTQVMGTDLGNNQPGTHSVANALAAKNVATWTIPIQVSIELGPNGPQISGASTNSSSNDIDVVESLRVPIVVPGLASRSGYFPEFLNPQKPVLPPRLTAKGKAHAARLEDDSHELKYHKFSVYMNRKRRFALLTAANVDWRKKNRRIDGHKPTRSELTGIPHGYAEKWITDPRIAEMHQLPDDFLQKDRKAFQKGHLVRRADVCWGNTFKDIQTANGDTFYTTNCSPQVANFNMSTRGKYNWGDLENLVRKQTKTEKAMVFAAPVYAKDDPEFEGVDSRGAVRIQIPQRFWKIVVVDSEQGLKAFGFVLEQDLSEVQFEEMTVPTDWLDLLVSISEIQALAGGLLDFKSLAKFDQHDSLKRQDLQRTPRKRK